MGVDASGINREVSTIMENADRIRDRKAKTLAIVETSVFGMAEAATKSSLIEDFPNMIEVTKGILPSLEVLVQRSIAPTKLVTAATLNPELRSQCVDALLFGVGITFINAVPDADVNPAARTTDPYGNDYSCRLCSKELPNLYFHCEGCEKLLGKDYDICPSCFSDGSFLRLTKMSGVVDKKFSDYQHTGQTVDYFGSKECRCKQGLCHGCKTKDISPCRVCSCKCHKKFSQRYRFRTNDETELLLQKCISAAGNEKIPYYLETVHRLQGIQFDIKNDL